MQPIALNNDLSLYQAYLARAYAALVGVIVLSVFLYATFLLLAVAHTASRTTADRQVGVLTAQVADLEMQYLSSAKDLTLERAQTLGFVTPANGTVSTVYATAASRSLSLRTIQ